MSIFATEIQLFSCINTEKLHKTDKNINRIQVNYNFFSFKRLIIKKYSHSVD